MIENKVSLMPAGRWDGEKRNLRTMEYPYAVPIPTLRATFTKYQKIALS